MKIVRNSRAAIGVEATTGKIRLLSADTTDDERPPYVGNATYLHLSRDELVICNMVAKGLTRAQIRLIGWWARCEGYRWIYAERLPGHTLPSAARRANRPMLGWFEIDLHAAFPQGEQEAQCV